MSKAPFLAGAAIFAAGVLAIVFYLWDSSVNRGFHFGYFGEFNRVNAAVASIPGVVITKTWYNGDVDLEEFGITVTAGGKPMELFFGEQDPVRTMPCADAVSALQKRIERIPAP